MKNTIAALSLAVILAACGQGKVVTLQGTRYYQVGDNSFLVQANGSIDEADATALVRVLERHYREKQPQMASEVYEDVHMVYKGPLLGEIYRLCVLSHVEYLIQAVKAFDGSEVPSISRYVSHSRAGHMGGGGRTAYNCTYEHLHANGPFDITRKKVTVTEYVGYGERGGISAPKYGDIARDSYCQALKAMLSKIYDNASIRGLYRPVEEALVQKLIEFHDYSSRCAPASVDFVIPIHKVVFTYIKSPEKRREAFAGLRKNETAKEYFKYSAELSREAFKLGLDLYRKGEYERCVEALGDAILLDDEYDRAYYYRASSYQKLKSPGKAIDDLRTACKLKPRNAYYVAALGWRLYDTRDYLSAITKATKALELAPQDANTLKLRGWANYRIKEYGDALKDLNASIELHNTDPDAFQGRARVFLALKMYDLAWADAPRSAELGQEVATPILTQIRAGRKASSSQ